MITLQNTMFYKGGRYRSLLISATISALAAFAAVPFAAAESSYPLEGGTRTFVETGDGFDVVNTFTESGTLTVASETTVRALFVAGGGGGGGGGGDGGACPGSPGTDGGGDGTDMNAITAAGNGENGRGGGGGGSGWSSDNSPKDGGHGGSGVVILRYSFDPSMLAEPTVRLGDAVADIASAKIDFNVVSFGRDASSLTILLTATPMAGGAVVSGEFPVIGTGISSCVLRGLRADVAYVITAVATNDREASSALDVGTIVPYNRSVSAIGGDEVFEHKHRRIHVFTQSGTFEVAKGGLVDILVVGGGGSGGTGVGGGGGGGGVVWEKGVALTAGSYDVSVGAGGIPADYVNDIDTPNGTNGGNSSFDEIVAYGGGAGASWARKTGNAGGSGGGACGGGGGASGIEGQGYAGGTSGVRSSSGGGGAGGPGGNGGTGGNGVQKPASAVGGAGLACDITGETIRYGGGGGGGGGDGGACPGSSGTDGGGDGTDYNGGAGGDGLDGLGAGGGGSGYALPTANSQPGGRGGSGVVIVAYDIMQSGFMIILR